MWTIEYARDTRATPERVWALLADVAGWSRWNAGVAHAELQGAFASGSQFVMRLPDGECFASRLILVVAPQGFIDETQVGCTTVRVHHRVVPRDGGGCRIRYVAEVSGGAEAEVGAAVTSDFPEVLAALAALAEAPAETAAEPAVAA